MNPKQKNPRRLVKILLAIAGGLVVAFMIYFPGCQTPIAFTLATGIGVSSLQARVDLMEEKAINGKAFTDNDKTFLRNLYACFAKGGRLVVVLRQSSQMMRRYLGRSGEDLRTSPRVFVNSTPVQNQMTLIKKQILKDIYSSKEVKESYLSDTFYMGDPMFFDSFVGLYYGRVFAKPVRTADRKLTLRWRAECPWEWPSYASLFEKYGEHHAQCFPLPNALSMVLGPQYCLEIDDGLGGHLVTLGIAKPFLVWSEWTEEMDTRP
jgi:hypothetical protein